MYSPSLYALRAIPSLLGATLLAIAGCIPAEEADGRPPMCVLDADCDFQNGEVCDDGVCWGDPPPALGFAAMLVGPEDQKTLAPTEVPLLDISADGTISDLVFADHVKIAGRVVLACSLDANPLECNPDLSIAAQVRARRPSRIPGGPEYIRTVSAAPGHGHGEIAFELYLPVAADDNESIEISIVPEDSNPNEQTNDVLTPAELAPPIRFSLVPTQEMTSVVWTLGDPLEHKVAVGRVLDAAGRGIAGMRVWALGQWTPAARVERASSISTTDEDGRFEVRIPLGMHELYDLIAQPSPDTVAPTLRMHDVLIEDPDGILPDGNVVEINDLHMPSHAGAMEFVLPVNGQDSGGTVVPVAGADVRLTTILAEEGRVEATFTDQGYTGQDGNVTLKLIPAGLQQNRIYVARVIPPPSSEHATLDEVTVAVGQGDAGGPSFLAGPTLSRRVPMHGTVINADGEPVAEATVLTRASLELKWGLALDAQAELEYLQFPSDTTGENGEFKLWVDPILVGNLALYDLEVIPPAGANAPRWSIAGVGAETESNLDGVNLGPIKLPPASFARGLVSSAPTGPIADAEIRLYQLADDNAICMGAIIPGGSEECTAPATLRGLWKSDENGQVEIVLPDPQTYR